MPPHLEELNTLMPRINFLMDHLTLNVFSGSLKNRFIVSILAVFNICFIYFLFTHLRNTINVEINFNSLTSLLLFVLLCGYGIRTYVGVFKKKNIIQLIKNIKHLYEEKEEDEELEFISRKYFMNFMRIFQIINRWGIRLFLAAAVFSYLYFRLNEDYGLIIDVPFIASNSSTLSTETLYALQGVMMGVMSNAIISLDLGIIFMGIQVTAELYILIDNIKLMNEKIKTDPNFLRKIIKRHCSVIENVKLLNNIIFEASSVQLIFTFVSLLFGFTFLIKHSMGIGNYMIIICGATLGLPICILGEFINVKTDELSDTLYFCNWYDLNLRDQKIFLVTIGMAQREYKLKALGMYNVNIYIFVQILKIAFTYCALLYSLSK
uniref:Odorant receptor n=1 Tax=Lutzomyia longipalpis TaxID=7200 RepID=A0A3F2ZDH7_LUTLO